MLVDHLAMLVQDWDIMLGSVRLLKMVMREVAGMNDLVGRVEREAREGLLFDAMS